jgi:hypothetical protein
VSVSPSDPKTPAVFKGTLKKMKKPSLFEKRIPAHDTPGPMLPLHSPSTGLISKVATLAMFVVTLDEGKIVSVVKMMGD